MAATVEKISASIPTEILEWAREKAEAEATSLSAIVTEALRRWRKLEAMDHLLEELGTDDITEDDRAATRAEWRANGML